MLIKASRSIQAELRAERAADDDHLIEGYFAVFNTPTELFPGAFEKVAPGAFDKTLSNDVRALINHDSTLVLGRSKAGTLSLKVDGRGLWGSVKINPQDSDAMNMYERVKRGDVDQCSFGFNIIKEDTEFRDDGSVIWTLQEVDLHEVSICTFPAYADTAVQARKADLEAEMARRLAAQKHELRRRLNHAKATGAE